MPKKAKILIVDDSSFMRGSLKYLMEANGHEVVGTAGNTKDALKIYKEVKPDLVTMDILMPGESGLVAAQCIKQEFPEAKIIMITALGQEEEQKKAKDIGVAGYIRKPFKEDEVLAVINKALGAT